MPQGSGRLGPYLLKALQDNPAFDVTVITRTNSTATFPEGTKLIKVTEGYPEDEIVEAFKGQDAVILSLGFLAGQYHGALAAASKKAGVKRLITGWGGNNANQEAQKIFPLGKKEAMDIKALEALESPEWSWTAVCCGLFFILLVHPHPRRNTMTDLILLAV
jgi:putative NADH-flavin reductase